MHVKDSLLGQSGKDEESAGTLSGVAAVGGLGCAGLLLYMAVVVGLLASIGVGAGAAVLAFRWVTGL